MNDVLLIEDVTIGSDCEYFLQDKENGKIISAENIIKGTKDEPFQFDANNPWFRTSLDNVMAEGNIPPTKEEDEFIQHMNKLRGYIESVIPPTLKTLSQGSARLDWGQLQTDSAKTFGCAESNNCWTGEIEEVYCKRGNKVRASGLHIHFGYKNPDYLTNILIAKACDAFLGVPSVLIDPDTDRKRIGYGRAGNYRMCPYGVEYRVLSGYFASSEQLLRWSYRQAKKAIEFVNAGRIVEIEPLGEEIQFIINKSSKRRAKEFVEKFNIELI